MYICEVPRLGEYSYARHLLSRIEEVTDNGFGEASAMSVTIRVSDKISGDRSRTAQASLISIPSTPSEMRSLAGLPVLL